MAVGDFSFITKLDAAGNPYKVYVKEVATGIFAEVMVYTDDDAAALGAAIAAALPGGGGSAADTTYDPGTNTVVTGADVQAALDAVEVFGVAAGGAIAAKVDAAGVRDTMGSGAVDLLGYVSGTVVADDTRFYVSMTLVGATELTLPLVAIGGTYHYAITQDATGGRVLTFTTDPKWAGGVEPTWTTTANGTDVLTVHIVGVGGTAYGSALLNVS